MRKLIGYICTVVLMLLCVFSASAGNGDSYTGTNENAQNYSLWADTVKSYIHNCDDGRLMRVQYLDDKNTLLIEYYNNSFDRIDSKLLDLKYPVMGGFYAIGDTYFILTGQSNPTESSDVVCFAVTKYDKNWKEIATAELKDCNTTIPFRAGSARFCHSGKYLLIRTCHQMYKAYDGENHQANMTFQLDINSMQITDSHTAVASVNYGYVSHSFNQFIKTDSDKIVALDHGDAHPRSVVLIKYETDVSSGKFVPPYNKPCTAIDVLEISGKSGDNYTGCSVGGFEVSSAGYLTCYNSISQGTSSEIRDVYISFVSANGTAADTEKLTSYSSPGASTPILVKINDEKFMVLWSYDGRVHYCTVDERGNRTSDILSFEGSLSDCQPILHSGNVIWYVWNNEKVTFYTISINDISKTNEDSFVSGHSYASSAVNGTTVSLKCTECGKAEIGKIPSEFLLYWEIYASADGTSVSFSSQCAEVYHPNKTIRIIAEYSKADLNEFEVVSSDSSVAKVLVSGETLAIKTVAEGTAKITIRSKYNPQIKTQYTLNVSHHWEVSENVGATCTESGKTVKMCTVCGESKSEIIQAKGHKMSGYSVVKEATCKAGGEKVSSCSLCGYEDSIEIPKRDHDQKVTINAVAPTCTKQGKTAGKKCSVCDKVTVEQESISALGHDLSEYKISKKPTCTAQGEETAKCTRCSYTKAQAVSRIPHTEVTVKAVAPTCTKQGKTAGKKCSVCDRITVEQESIPALGHDLGEYKISKKPTCTSQGEETAKCTRCSYTKAQSVARIPHTEVAVKSVAPTCTKQGKTAGKKCSVCDKVTVEQESVPALGHELGEYKITKKPTCTAQGEETAKCTRCSYTKAQSVARIPHTEVAVKAVAPTCTKQGKTAGKKCSVCDKITAEQESIPALGHDLGEYKITKKPTCTAQGEETAKCTRCSYTKAQSVARIPHTEVAVKSVAPTCTKQGKTAGKKCSVCDRITVEQESIPALGHDLGEYKISKKPTCTAQGEETAKCTRCSYTKTQSVARLAHTEVTVKAVAPTCTKQGKTAGKKCSVCDKITAEQESVPALGHELGEYETTKDATCSAKGEKTAKCIRCTYSKTADIPKLEHVEKTLKAVKPTCTKTGKTQGKKCSLCDKVTVAQESIPALGHSKKTKVLAKATAKANGKIVTRCETCGKSFGENRVYRIQSVTLSKTKYTCDGKVKTPKVTVVDYNKDQLIKDRDYTVTYQKGRKAVGKYSVTVKFKGKYSGKVTLNFEIKLAKVEKLTVTADKTTVKLKWNTVKDADGYQVYYSEKENDTYKKLADVKKTSFKKTKLKSGKKYYFKVRAYKKTAEGNFYGSFSKVKSAKIK